MRQGFHLRFANPAVIEKERQGPVLRLGKEGRAKATENYSSRIKELVQRGILTRGSYWHRELGEGFAWERKNMLFLWTGYFVRPAPGVWLLVSGAFNRRCPVKVDEYVIADGTSFVPVILSLDHSALQAKESWLDAELACLTPLRPGVSFSFYPLKERQEVGRSWCTFYDAKYLDARSEKKYAGRYRTITSGECNSKPYGTAKCELVIAGGARLHRIATFRNFATASGRSRSHPEKNLLQFIIIRNISDLKMRWDGMTTRDITTGKSSAGKRFLKDWENLYGTENLPSAEWLAQYTFPAQHGLSHVPITPWVFAVTPPGWSSLIDSYDLPGLYGMRGVVSSDIYFGVPPLWQFRKTGRISIPRGTPLARVLPIPRSLLQASYQQIPL